VNLHGRMSSLLQDRSPFVPVGYFYCGFRVERLQRETRFAAVDLLGAGYYRFYICPNSSALPQL
jgi:hypothetical protein